MNIIGCSDGGKEGRRVGKEGRRKGWEEGLRVVGQEGEWER